MKTRAQLINRVLLRLGEDGGAGQAPQAESVATVDDALDGVLGSLRAREIVDVDPDHVPDELYDPLSWIIADAVSDDFGLLTEEAARMKQRADTATDLIRRIVWQPADSPVMRIQYF